MKPAHPDSFFLFQPALSSLRVFFEVVINKNPCERWLYSRVRAEGMEFITRFDWVTPQLSSRSKQLLDFHFHCDLPLLPFLCSPLHKTQLLILPLTLLPFPSPLCMVFLSDNRTYLCFLFFFPFSNFVTFLAFLFSSFQNVILLDTLHMSHICTMQHALSCRICFKDIVMTLYFPH